jgi:endonuclease YncB( thermonuclease family)
MGWNGGVERHCACWLPGILAGVMAVASSDARAQDGASGSAGACRFESVGTGKVAAVVDGRSFILDDGREIRLAGIEVPPLPAAGETGARAAAALAAKAALDAMLAGRTVELRQRQPAADRYGRILAHVDMIGGGPPQPVAQELVARGYARVAPDIGPAACAAELLGRERGARAGKLGLWREPYYLVAAAENLPGLLAERGHFTVVEGKVLSVRETGGTIYMNFGRRWTQALTVTISKRREPIFAAAGLTPKTLENRRVRVRGWVEERGGPRIEATRPEQIEIAERN